MWHKENFRIPKKWLIEWYKVAVIIAGVIEDGYQEPRRNTKSFFSENALRIYELTKTGIGRHCLCEGISHVTLAATPHRKNSRVPAELEGETVPTPNVLSPSVKQQPASGTRLSMPAWTTSPSLVFPNGIPSQLFVCDRKHKFIPHTYFFRRFPNR